MFKYKYQSNSVIKKGQQQQHQQQQQKQQQQTTKSTVVCLFKLKSLQGCLNRINVRSVRGYIG